MKRGFTIVELIVVVGIIAILVSIVVVAATGVMRGAREKRADAMRVALEQGIASYYAQQGKWPKTIEDYAQQGEQETVHAFSASETDAIFRDVVGAAFGKGSSGLKSLLVDASALYVVRTSRLSGGEGCHDNHTDRTKGNYCGNRHCVAGIDFSLAVQKGSDNIPFSEMSFGYPGREYGKFCRFWVKYNSKTDMVTVSK